MKDKSKRPILKDTHASEAVEVATGGTAIESSPDVRARIAQLEARITELEKIPKGQEHLREIQRQQQAARVLQQAAGLLATGATVDQLRNLPGPIAMQFERHIGPDWVDKAVALFEAAKAEQSGQVQ